MDLLEVTMRNRDELKSPSAMMPDPTCEWTLPVHVPRSEHLGLYCDHPDPQNGDEKCTMNSQLVLNEAGGGLS